jgi:hypothetical protein
MPVSRKKKNIKKKKTDYHRGRDFGHRIRGRRSYHQKKAKKESEKSKEEI